MDYITFMSVVFFFHGVLAFGIHGQKLCESPQYIELHKTGIINCEFEVGFFGVFWYNSTNYRSDFPIIAYQDKDKEGPGYTSGEFDVQSNGSLIIRNVTLKHEHSFTATYLYSEHGTSHISIVSVVVIVKPKTSFPVINICGRSTNMCLTSSDLVSVATCRIDEARPPVALKIFLRTREGDQDISNVTSVSSGDSWFDSEVIATISYHVLPSLTLFVCRAVSPEFRPFLNESMLLVHNEIGNTANQISLTKYFEINTKMELICTNFDFSLLVWKKRNFTEHSLQNVLFASFIGENITKVSSNDYSLGKAGSLVVSKVGVKHEGFYNCWYDSNSLEEPLRYKAIIYVNPSPPYIIVDDCSLHQKCVLQTPRQGKLTCSLKGVRPKVKLTWRVFPPNLSSLITFTNDQMIISDRGSIYDVSFTSHFQIQGWHNGRLTIECKVSEPEDVLFNLSSVIELWLLSGEASTTIQLDEEKVSERVQFWWLLAIILPVGLVVLFLYQRKTIKAFKGRNEELGYNDDETVPMASTTRNVLDDDSGKSLFITQLKNKYKILCNAVQTLPYIKDRLCCVDRVFVEGGIQCLVDLNTYVEWQPLESYKDILCESKLKSKRCVIEGEPGYGKSTLTLQIAYDWCNKTESSYLNYVEVLILLKMRQLGSVESFYEAIKQFLLPSDSLLEIDDVRTILTSCKSVVVLLDGYDEYPEPFDRSKSDFIRIIEYAMCQEFEVVITTRPSVLPPMKLPDTKRIRLTGFDKTARKSYIRKAVVGDDNSEAINKIEEQLKSNPVLSELCQAPLFFVVFAHMSYESEHFTQLTSVTQYFRYMMSTIHSHMKNKLETKDDKCEYYEHEHSQLDQVAFEALARQTKGIVWRKKELEQKLGQDFYNIYVKIGIFVEDEVLNINDSPRNQTRDHIEYYTKVTFYHKLFCEWYAAHYLSDYVKGSSSEKIGEFLRECDPFELQYSYRFACGLNKDVGRLIITYLQRSQIQGADKFAVLCSLELSENVDDILKYVYQLSNEGFVVSGTDSLLLQRSTINFLDFASRHKICIKYVKLHNSIRSVELSTGKIILNSALHLSSEIITEALAIDFTNRPMTRIVAEDLLRFATMCPVLKLLSFDCCTPPWFFEDKSCLQELEQKKIRVVWKPYYSTPLLSLSLTSGYWEDSVTQKAITHEQYEMLVSKVIEESIHRTSETDQAQVEKIRRLLRSLNAVE